MFSSACLPVPRLRLAHEPYYPIPALEASLEARSLLNLRPRGARAVLDDIEGRRVACVFDAECGDEVFLDWFGSTLRLAFGQHALLRGATDSDLTLAHEPFHAETRPQPGELTAPAGFRCSLRVFGIFRCWLLSVLPY